MVLSQHFIRWVLGPYRGGEAAGVSRSHLLSRIRMSGAVLLHTQCAFMLCTGEILSFFKVKVLIPSTQLISDVLYNFFIIWQHVSVNADHLQAFIKVT